MIFDGLKDETKHKNDSGSGIPLIQDSVTSNAGAWLSNATLRFFNLAEQCHTH